MSSTSAPAIAAGHGRCWINRLHRYAVVSRSGLGARRGTSFFSGRTKKPAMSTMTASGRADGERGDLQPDADEGDGDEAGGDEAAPAGAFDPFAGEAQQCGQQRERGEDRDGDDRRGADGEALHEVHAHEAACRAGR